MRLTESLQRALREDPERYRIELRRLFPEYYEPLGPLVLYRDLEDTRSLPITVKGEVYRAWLGSPFTGDSVWLGSPLVKDSAWSLEVTHAEGAGGLEEWQLDLEDNSFDSLSAFRSSRYRFRSPSLDEVFRTFAQVFVAVPIVEILVTPGQVKVVFEEDP